MLSKYLITVGYIAIPILWGIAVNGLFDLWNGRDHDESDDDGIFPDYQI